MIDRTCARRARPLLMAAVLAAAPAAFAGQVVNDNGRYRFVEDFRWQGNHAATIAAGASTTVWLDESSWDVRGDKAAKCNYAYLDKPKLATGGASRLELRVHFTGKSALGMMGRRSDLVCSAYD